MSVWAHSCSGKRHAGACQAHAKARSVEQAAASSPETCWGWICSLRAAGRREACLDAGDRRRDAAAAGGGVLFPLTKSPGGATPQLYRPAADAGPDAETPALAAGFAPKRSPLGRSVVTALEAQLDQARS